MARAGSLAKLACACGVRLTRRRLTRARPQLPALTATYAREGIRSLESSEGDRLRRLVTCINCGLCRVAANRVRKTRPPRRAARYMRLDARMGDACSDAEG